MIWLKKATQNRVEISLVFFTEQIEFIFDFTDIASQEVKLLKFRLCFSTRTGPSQFWRFVALLEVYDNDIKHPGREVRFIDI